MSERDDTRAVPVRTGVRAEVRRYPLQPLLDRIGGSGRSAARELGISGSTEQEYRKRGVTERVADRLAAKVGLVAYEVWPEMLDDVIAAALKNCAGPDCGEQFTPYRSTSLYCSKSCQRRAGRARQSAERRAAQARRLRRWKDENAEARRAYNREYQRSYMRRVRARQRSEGEAA